MSAAGRWRWHEVVAGDDVREPLGLGEPEVVAAAEFGNRGKFGRTGLILLAQLTEELLEPGGSDDLQNPGRRAPGIPHGVDLTARLEDEAARPQDRLLVVRAKADLAFKHDRNLVLEAVDVRRDERSDLERVPDDRQRASGVPAGHLENHVMPGRRRATSPSPGRTTLTPRGGLYDW